MSETSFFLAKNKHDQKRLEKRVPGESALWEFYMTQRKTEHIHFPLLPAVLLAQSAAFLPTHLLADWHLPLITSRCVPEGRP
jgi:hypothetical protein